MKHNNPTPTVDIIIQRDSRVMMVKRKRDPFKGQLALPGGFMNEGETAEDAMKREAMEEASLVVDPIEILGVYSDPKRDPRKHTLTIVFIGIIVAGSGEAGDDADSIEWVDLATIESRQIAFDHMTILHDYKKWRASGGTFWSTKRRNE